MISFVNKTKSEKPAIGWEKLKKEILGGDYDLDIVFTGDGVIKNLNKRYNKKNKTTNVLSFPLDGNCGEIFINLSYVRKEAERAGASFTDRLNYLYIHSLLHLKGFEHGALMENEEKKIAVKNDKFKI